VQQQDTQSCRSLTVAGEKQTIQVRCMQCNVEKTKWKQ